MLHEFVVEGSKLGWFNLTEELSRKLVWCLQKFEVDDARNIPFLIDKNITAVHISQGKCKGSTRLRVVMVNRLGWSDEEKKKPLKTNYSQN